MTIVSLTDCCHLLAIDAKTLRRWMSLSRLVAQPHPIDARLKCVTSEQVQQLAAAHRRTLPDQEEQHFQPGTSAPLTSATSTPVLSNALPDLSAYLTSLTMQLDSLQDQVAIFQRQLVLLTDQLKKEREWRTSVAETNLDKSQEPCQENSSEFSQENSEEFSQGKSQESSQEKSRDEEPVRPSPSIDRRKLPHVLPQVQYGAQGKYVVICPQRGLLEFSPDSPEWFAWLSTLSSFRFVGASGHLTVHRHGCNPRWTWRATRSIHSRSRSLHLVRTEFLTLAVLEQAAASLQSLLN